MVASNSEYLRAADEAAAELVRREDLAAEVVTGPLAEFMARAEEQHASTWPGDDAPLQQRISAALVLALTLDQADVLLLDARAQLAGIVNNLGILGASLSVVFARLSDSFIQPRIQTTSAQSAVTSKLSEYSGEIEVARRMITAATTDAAVRQGLDTARKLVPRVDGLARWVVADAYHRSLEETAAQDPDLLLIWRAERDACLNCLAYAGEIVRPGRSYPPGLTFGDKPLSHKGPVKPPLHPRCRCEQIVWRRTGDSLPDALKREARRSVLRGWGDASGPASGRAAKRLLESGVDAPQTVLNAARRLVLKYDA